MVIFYIATDKVLVEKQEENEILQEKIMSLTLQLKEREEAISLLMEKMKSKKTTIYRETFALLNFCEFYEFNSIVKISLTNFLQLWAWQMVTQKIRKIYIRKKPQFHQFAKIS